MPAIITLTSDFGLSDPFVGVMKGVILSRAPEARIIDLCHGIAPQDISQAAALIHGNYRFFPAGTIHVVVVDPGVGTSRRLILLAAGHHYFLLPDNGLCTPFLQDGSAEQAFVAERPDLYLQPLSRTFHGRDILAPLAAWLAAGQPPASLGPAIALTDLLTLPLPAVQIDHQQRTISGVITAIDHFGNLMTNISQAAVTALARPGERLRIAFQDHGDLALYPNYAFFPEKKLAAIFNSGDNLELAVNRGNAAILTNARLYDTVTVYIC